MLPATTPTTPIATTTATTGYRLRTASLERARVVALAQTGVSDVRVEGDELRFAAEEEAVAALSIALGQARVGVTALVPQTASLEELFLGLTEEDAEREQAVA